MYKLLLGVAFLAVLGLAYIQNVNAQTYSPSPSPTETPMATKLPSGAPRTGFGK